VIEDHVIDVAELVIILPVHVGSTDVIHIFVRETEIAQCAVMIHRNSCSGFWRNEDGCQTVGKRGAWELWKTALEPYRFHAVKIRNPDRFHTDETDYTDVF